MDDWVPPSDWLCGVKDASVSLNLRLTELKFVCGGAPATSVALFSEESSTVAFPLTPPLSHPVEQLACVLLCWVVRAG